MGYYSIRNRVGFCIYSESGADYGKFINALRDSPVQFYGLAVRGDKLYGYVRKSDYPRLCGLAEKHRLTSEIVTRRGIYYVTKGYHLRFGVIAGFLLAIAMTAFLADRVMVIEIGGNENISEERVISLLEDAGIYVGSKISDVDLREAERKILGMDKDIAWIGIRHTGSRVVVEIDEMNRIPEMERKNTPCNIVAARDAQIKSVKVYNGMLIPMVGDGVSKGDVIISGVVDTKYGRSYYVHSIGEITGIYTEKMTFSQPLRDEETICVGEVTKKAVSFFGKRFVYFSDGDVTGEYEYYEEEFPVKLGKITFPLSKIEMHYRLTESAEIIRTEAEAEEMLHEKIVRYEQNFLSDDVTVTDKKVTKTSDSKAVTVTVVYTVEGEIGTERQIFARYEGFYGNQSEKEESKE